MNVRLSHTLNFSAGVWVDHRLCMNLYTLNLDMITNGPEYEVAFERIKYFVYNTIEHSVFINSDDKEQCARLVGAGISVTTLPGPPVDQLVGIMMFHKLNAITEQQIIIDQTEISSMLGEQVRFLHCEDENINLSPLPKWWMTSDLSHRDWDLVDSAKVVTLRSVDWNELNLGWANTRQEKKQGNTVVFPEFENSDAKK